jgi:hypothetical protein
MVLSPSFGYFVFADFDALLALERQQQNKWDGK